MENAKKMILIEPEFIDRLKKERAIENPASRLDVEMQKILHSKLDDREKWTLYLQSLQRYFHFTGEERQPIKIPIITEGIANQKENERILNTTVSEATSKEEDVKPKIREPVYYSPDFLIKRIPKTYQKKGELLINSLLDNQNKITWDQSGCIIIDDETIPSTNIRDLIDDSLRSFKNREPHGWERFMTVLKDINAPLSCIGNRKRLDYINKLYLKDYRTPNSKLRSPISSKPKSSKVIKKIDWERWNPY